MARRSMFCVAACGLALLAAPALAQPDPPPKVVRLIGETAGPAPLPRRIVLDLQVTPGDAAFHDTVEGWLADVSPDGPGDGEGFQGECVEGRCTFSVDLDAGTLALVGQIDGAGPSDGRVILKEQYEEKVLGQGTIRLTPVRGAIADVGELAAPDAVSSRELADLLIWNGSSAGFGDDSDEWPDSFERDALKDWQTENQRPGAGLILVEDLKLLRANAQAAKAEAGWSTLGSAGEGWTASYPAKVLTKGSGAGGEHRFESADGKARLVLSLGPGLDSDGFDAFWEKTKTDSDAFDRSGYSRVNNDFEISWRDKGVVTYMVAHNRQGGLATMVFTYPEAQEDTYDRFKTALGHDLKVSDRVKAGG